LITAKKTAKVHCSSANLEESFRARIMENVKKQGYAAEELGESELEILLRYNQCMLWIRIRKIRKFLGHLDLNPDPLVTVGQIRIQILPSSNKRGKINLDFFCFVTS
jgi:hypothetical protein